MPANRPRQQLRPHRQASAPRRIVPQASGQPSCASILWSFRRNGPARPPSAPAKPASAVRPVIAKAHRFTYSDSSSSCRHGLRCKPAAPTSAREASACCSVGCNVRGGSIAALRARGQGRWRRDGCQRGRAGSRLHPGKAGRDAADRPASHLLRARRRRRRHSAWPAHL